MTDGWIGVDLDGTLAVDLPGRHDPSKIGPPIPLMLARVRKLLADGEDVRIFTARVFAPPEDRQRLLYAAIARQAILHYCLQHFGRQLPITCQKDFKMKRLYDDRAVQVEKNTGRIIEGCLACTPARRQ